MKSEKTGTEIVPKEPANNRGSIRRKLLGVLKNSPSEREIIKFLAKNARLLRGAFCRTGGHETYVVKEFPFGNRFRADFVVAMSYSGAWNVHMIELEPPSDKIITRNGTPSQRLNKAISQINDWASYVKIHLYEVRKDLSDWCEKRDLLGYSGGFGSPSNYTGDDLQDPKTFIWYHYHIVIGRREAVLKEQREKMNQLREGMKRVELCTYDRFIDVARSIDKSEAELRKLKSPIEKRNERMEKVLENILAKEKVFISKIRKMEPGTKKHREMKRLEAEIIPTMDLLIKTMKAPMFRETNSDVLGGKLKETVNKLSVITGLMAKLPDVAKK